MKKKGLKYRNKDMVAAVAQACEMPREDAKPVVKAILKAIIVQINRDKRVVVPRFGRFSKRVQMVRPITRTGHWKKMKPAVHVRFTAAKELRRVLDNEPNYKRFDFAFRLARKIRRLVKEKDLVKAKYFRDMLVGHIEVREWTRLWLLRHGGVPDVPELPKRRRKTR